MDWSTTVSSCWSGDCAGMCGSCGSGKGGYVIPIQLHQEPLKPPRKTILERYQEMCEIYENSQKKWCELKKRSAEYESKHRDPDVSLCVYSDAGGSLMPLRGEDNLTRARVLYDYDGIEWAQAMRAQETLLLRANEVVVVTYMDETTGWWRGYVEDAGTRMKNSFSGFFDSSCVKVINPTENQLWRLGPHPSVSDCMFLHSFANLEGNIPCENGYYYNADIVNRQRNLSEEEIKDYQRKFETFQEEMDGLLTWYNYKSPEEPGIIENEHLIDGEIYTRICEIGGQACDDPECCMILHCMQEKPGYWDDGGVVDYYQRLPIYTKNKHHELCALCISKRHD